MNSGVCKILSLSLSSVFLTQVGNAQSVIDAGKYGQTASYGTARSIGFGGALGSVGGDFSTVNVNPAGLGMYRTSEFMLTPGLRFNGTNSEYTGTSSSDNGTRFGFNNIGTVFTSKASGRDYENADWKSVSFGIGVNHTADFSRDYNYRGTNNKNSGSQYFEADALNYPSSTTDDQGTPAYLGYQSYLLSSNRLSLVPIAKGLDQFKSVQEKGGVNEFALSLGGNYQEKFLLGATLGITMLNHKVNTSYVEKTHDANASDSFDRFTYNESYKTTGTGVNLKLGAIYKFNDYFRAGIAFHTPTFYSMTETSGNDINVVSKLYGSNKIVSPSNQNDYHLTTPFKAILSATGMLGKYGFVSVDYEYVNYATMRYNMDNKTTQNSYNASIKNIYGSASNIRGGVELRFDQFRVRGGMGYYGSPYKSGDYQTNRTDISFGFGYRFEDAYVDFGIVNSAYTTQEQPYVLDGSMGYSQPTIATTKNSLTSGVLTVGWKF
ncbi:MAG: hypothetical protein QM530_00535 [Phycisphaerales bacterium]|nr:hypothetical protein [Phycisphaerales bacterium]